MILKSISFPILIKGLPKMLNYQKSFVYFFDAKLPKVEIPIWPWFNEIVGLKGHMMLKCATTTHNIAKSWEERSGDQ